MEYEVYKAMLLIQQEMQKCKTYSEKMLALKEYDKATMFKNFADEIKTSSKSEELEETIKLIKTIKEKRLSSQKENEEAAKLRKEQRKAQEESSCDEQKIKIQTEIAAEREANRIANEAVCNANRIRREEERLENIKKEKEILESRMKKALDIREGLFDYDVDEKLFNYLTVRQVIKIIFKSGVINYKDQLYLAITSASRKAVRWYDVRIDRRDDNSEIAQAAKLLTIGKVIEFLERTTPALYTTDITRKI